MVAKAIQLDSDALTIGVNQCNHSLDCMAHLFVDFVFVYVRSTTYGALGEQGVTEAFPETCSLFQSRVAHGQAGALLKIMNV